MVTFKCESSFRDYTFLINCMLNFIESTLNLDPADTNNKTNKLLLNLKEIIST